jgi:hypothetical protein
LCWLRFCYTKQVVKSPKVIAALLVGNLALFAGILTYVLKAKIAAPVTAEETSSSEFSPAAISLGSTSVVEKLVTVTNELKWAQLESEDYKTYIARLREIGCPEQTIRDIIIADLDKLLAPEVATASGRRKVLKYWHPEEEELLNDVNPHEAFLKEQQIDKRKREIIRELVGADLQRERMKSTGHEDYYERRLSFLPEERRTQVRELLEKFDEAEQRLRDKDLHGDGVPSATDRAQLRILREQRNAEMEQLLNPQEKTQFDLWLSPTANSVRHALYGMNATEQEFQAVYQARKAYEDLWAGRDPELLDPSTRQQMEQAKQDMEGAIFQGLGEQRYADYQRGQDDDFHLLSALVTRFKLPREKAAEVYGYKAVTLSYRDQIAADPNLTLDQKKSALQAVTQETRTAVQSLLGTKAFNHYLGSGQAQWIGE